MLDTGVGATHKTRVTSKPAPRPTDRRARAQERTRDDIVEAAARVFAASGFHGATMQAIAREAGFTAASLYTYFPGKDEIWEALIARVKGAIFDTFDEPLPSGLTLAQRLELLVQRQGQIVRENQEALLVILQHEPSRDLELAAHSELVDRFAAFLEAGPEKLRVPTLEAARILFGILHTDMLLGLHRDHLPAAGDAARLIDLFLHGVARPARP